MNFRDGIFRLPEGLRGFTTYSRDRHSKHGNTKLLMPLAAIHPFRDRAQLS